MKREARYLAAFAALAVCVSSALTAQATANSRVVARPINANDDPTAQLFKLGPARFGPDGLIYVTEYSSTDIRIIDTTGKFIAKIGRKGAGPGEFTRVDGFGWLGDTLWVLDKSQYRTTLFDKSHRYISSFSSRVEGVVGWPEGDVLTPSGRFIQAVENNREAIADAPLLKVSRTGQVLETLAPLTFRRTMVQTITNVGGKRRGYSLVQPFPDQAIWDVDRMGRWLAIAYRSAPTASAATRMEVRVDDLKGGTSRVIALPYTPVGIRRSVLDSVFKLYSPDLSADHLRSVLYLPNYFSPVRRVVVSDDGAVWLQRLGEASGTWVRLDAQGVVTDTVRIPAEYTVTDARGRDLLAIVSEADEINPPLMIFHVLK